MKRGPDEWSTARMLKHVTEAVGQAGADADEAAEEALESIEDDFS